VKPKLIGIVGGIGPIRPICTWNGRLPSCFPEAIDLPRAGG